jgi:hypothetical protein
MANPKTGSSAQGDYLLTKEDISTLVERGHFYFGLTGHFIRVSFYQGIQDSFPCRPAFGKTSSYPFNINRTEDRRNLSPFPGIEKYRRWSGCSKNSRDARRARDRFQPIPEAYGEIRQAVGHCGRNSSKSCSAFLYFTFRVSENRDRHTQDGDRNKTPCRF